MTKEQTIIHLMQIFQQPIHKNQEVFIISNVGWIVFNQNNKIDHILTFFKLNINDLKCNLIKSDKLIISYIEKYNHLKLNNSSYYNSYKISLIDADTLSNVNI